MSHSVEELERRFSSLNSKAFRLSERKEADLEEVAEWVADFIELAANMLTTLKETQQNERELGRNVDLLGDDNASLRAWINDLQAGMYINCVYCGHRYGPETNVLASSMTDVLKAHIEQCPEHPMSHLRAWSDDAIRWMDEARKFVIGHTRIEPELLHIRAWVNLQSKYDALMGKKS